MCVGARNNLSPCWCYSEKVQIHTGLYKYNINLKNLGYLLLTLSCGGELQDCSCTRFKHTLATSGFGDWVSAKSLGLQSNPETDGQLRMLFLGLPMIAWAGLTPGLFFS